LLAWTVVSSPTRLSGLPPTRLLDARTKSRSFLETTSRWSRGQTSYSTSIGQNKLEADREPKDSLALLKELVQSLVKRNVDT